jgi:deoxyribonuclease-4
VTPYSPLGVRYFAYSGRFGQFGTLDEVLRISNEFEIYPCIDPAHLHARTNGKINTKEEWNDMIDQYQQALGKMSLSHVHFHYSGIAYTEKGERHHLPFEQSDARWKDFLKVLKDRKIGGTVVCESPAMENDTILLKKTYDRF